MEIIKRRQLLPADYTVFILELELKTSEIEFDIEKQTYPLVRHFWTSKVQQGLTPICAIQNLRQEP